AAGWYAKYVGGQRFTEPSGIGGDPRVMLGTTRLIFLKNENAQPSAGSVFDHVAFSVKDVEGTIAALREGGAKVVTPAHDEQRGNVRSGLVVDPWGVSIELIADPQVNGQVHHVHLRVPDPHATIQRYVDSFGGETGRLRGRWEGLHWGLSGNWV